jgi:uncharacterized repeat protein (TIGR01451 family)
VRWISKLLRLVAMLFAFAAMPALAATCGQATSQGVSGPPAWQTYCWLDMTTYNDTTARSAAGQNFSITLSDGATVTFNLKVTTTAPVGSPALSAVASPSWTGAAFGNSSFVGIPNKPVLYTATGGTVSTITLSSILITPPPGVPAVTAYSFVIADGESTAAALPARESIQLTTNGTGWVLLDTVDATSGPNLPTQTGLGSSIVDWVGNSGDPVGGYVIGTNSPTTISAKMTPIAGLEGVLFAVRFASLRLNKQIVGARANAADQFKFDIAATSSGTTLASGATSGAGLGPFAAAAVSLASGIPLTISESMAAGSVNSLSHYSSRLTCTNGATGSSTSVPTNVATTSYNFGTLQFGDAIQCTFTNTPFPHISVAKALAGTRFFATDQFTVQINQAATNIASATSTGTGATITGGSTGQTQLIASTAYTLTEIAASGSLTQYTSAMACTNAFAASTTTLTTVVGGTITPKLGDVINCIITNTPRASNGTLTIIKYSQVISDPINGTTNPKMIPGAVVRYLFTVASTGNTAITANSIILTDPLPSQFTYDASSLVQFANGTPASGLSAFNPATMVTFSSAIGGGTPYTYSPITSGYDANVKGIRIAPGGTMAAASAAGQPSFTVSFLGRIN